MTNIESSWFKKVVRYDSTGIKRLFEQYYIPLILFAKTYVRDEDVAKDVVQDVFYILIESGEKFTTIDNLKVYLYSAVKNKCLKYIRHEGVKERYEQYVWANEEKNEEDYHERILEEEVFTLLYQAIQELPGQCKKVFLLTLEGKGNAEIAEALGIGIETVKSHKKTGKRLLYAKLKDVVPLIVLVLLLALLKR